MLDAPHLRCSDADRDRAAEVLRDSLGEGRITVAELDDRLDRVYRAQTYGELTTVMGDLPAWLALTRAPALPAGYPLAPPVPAHPLARPPAAGQCRRSQLRAFALSALVVWILWGTAVRTVAGFALLAEVPLLLVAAWGFVLLARRHRRHPGRRLPPPT